MLVVCDSHGFVFWLGECVLGRMVFEVLVQMRAGDGHAQGQG